MNQCKKCASERVMNNYRQRGGYKATKKNRIRHGISYEKYLEMCAALDGKCQICQRNDVALNIDHDHKCCPGPYSCGKCIRGLLCRDCNTALGKFKDDLDRMRAAVKYLGRFD